MENKTFLVKTFGSTVEGTYLIVAGSKEEAEETYLQYRKEHVEPRRAYNDPLFAGYKKGYDVKEVVEIPLHETAIIHMDDGDR